MNYQRLILITFLSLSGGELYAQSTFDKKLERVEYCNSLRVKFEISQNRDSLFNLFFVAVDEMIDDSIFTINSLKIRKLDGFYGSHTKEALSFNIGGVLVLFPSDSSFFTVSWSDLGGGCQSSSSGYIVFDSKGKRVKRFFGNFGYSNRFISDIHTICLDSLRFYFIEGGGSTCGSKKFMQFDVHTWRNDSLVMVDSSEIWVWCNRSQSFNYGYFKYGKRFYINSFEMDEDVGFFTDKVQRVKFIWREDKFVLEE